MRLTERVREFIPKSTSEKVQVKVGKLFSATDESQTEDLFTITSLLTKTF